MASTVPTRRICAVLVAVVAATALAACSSAPTSTNSSSASLTSSSSASSSSSPATSPSQMPTKAVEPEASGAGSVGSGDFDELKKRVFAARDSIWAEAKEAVADEEAQKEDVVAAMKRFLANPENEEFSVSPIAGFSDSEIQIWIEGSQGATCSTRVWPLEAGVDACWLLSDGAAIVDDYAVVGSE